MTGLSLGSADAVLKDFYLGAPVEQFNNTEGVMAKKMGKLSAGKAKVLEAELARKGAKPMMASAGPRFSKMAAKKKMVADTDNDGD